MQTIIHGGLVIPATGQEPITRGIVAIEEGRIVAVGRGADLGELHSGVHRLDATGCTVLPGLIDGHVHVFTYPHNAGFTEAEATVWVTNYLRSALCAGVTSVRDLSSPWDAIHAVKRGVEEKWIVGPRMRVAGRAIAMTGGHGYNEGVLEADGIIGLRRAAREQLKHGADVIKLMATGGVATPGELPTSWQLEVDEMRAAVQEAHKRGRPATAHAYATGGIKNALLAGVDGIEHGVYLDDDVIERMLEQGTFLSPTMSVYHRIIEAGKVGKMPAYRVEKAKRLAEVHGATFRRAMEAGVKISMGTDAVSL
ncbi:MAG TPA: amidohydrolase family protein, partial [Anaerolineae bacterium]|nr:amidohydrolase family protein [Anaerolineae bacterium]